MEAWIRNAQSSGIKILMDAAAKLMTYKPFILNWYKHPIAPGKLEVVNRKIGLLRRQACGYRDEEYLHLRIRHLYHCTNALTGEPNIFITELVAQIHFYAT